MTTCLGKALYLCLSICVCASFTFGFEGGAWDLTE